MDSTYQSTQHMERACDVSGVRRCTVLSAGSVILYCTYEVQYTTHCVQIICNYHTVTISQFSNFCAHQLLLYLRILTLYTLQYGQCKIF